MSEKHIENHIAAIVACLAYNLVDMERDNKFKFRDDKNEQYEFRGMIKEDKIVIELTKPSEFYMKIYKSGSKYRYDGSGSGDIEVNLSGNSFRGRDSNTGDSYKGEVESDRVVFYNDNSGEKIEFSNFS